MYALVRPSGLGKHLCIFGCRGLGFRVQGFGCRAASSAELALYDPPSAQRQAREEDSYLAKLWEYTAPASEGGALKPNPHCVAQKERHPPKKEYIHVGTSLDL